MKSKKGKSKKTVSLMQLWKSDVNWSVKTKAEKIICLWFGLSAAATISFCWSWLVIPFAISLVCSLSVINDIDVEE